MEEPKTFMVEDATLNWMNFKGKEGMYNREGQKTFCVDIDPDIAEEMAADLWNVKYHNAQPGEEGPHIVPDPRPNSKGKFINLERPYIPVEARWDVRPPRVVMISSTARTNLTEDTVDVLDYVDIETCDLICRAYRYETNGKVGLKAYLQSMFVTIREDALERKYQANVDTSNEG